METLEEKIKKLLPELQEQVEEFVEALLKQRKGKNTIFCDRTGQGALKNLKDKYTSLELQHKLMEWRVEKIFRCEKIQS